MCGCGKTREQRDAEMQMRIARRAETRAQRQAQVEARKQPTSTQSQK